MMNTSWLKLLSFLTLHQIRYEFQQRERLLSLLLLAVNLLLLSWFAFGETNPDTVHAIVVAQIFTTAFIAMQLAFVRIFEPEEEDRAFDLLMTSPLPAPVWYLSKVMTSSLMGLLVVYPVLVLSAMVNQSVSPRLLSGEIFIFVAFVLNTLSAIGVLLSALILRANARQILYPLLYFPLTVPVLLSGVQVLLNVLQHGLSMQEQMSSWLGLLLVFNLMYFGFGLLFYGDLLKSN
jgi:heme exporter protein CcmB